jgi:hypothetical protein
MYIKSTVSIFFDFFHIFDFFADIFFSGKRQEMIKSSTGSRKIRRKKIAGSDEKLPPILGDILKK